MRTLALAPWLLIVACGGEDLSAAPDAQAPDAPAVVPDAAPWPEVCNSVEYTLGGITCASTDFSETLSLDAFVAAAGASRMHYEVMPDGSCGIAIRFEGDACTEDQIWTVGGGGLVFSDGIAACAPVGCTFGAGDDACAVGDHAAAAVPLDVAVVLDVGDLILTFQNADGVCAEAGYPIESQTWLVPN